MNKQIVIARYKEDISWTQYLTEDTIIYSKGGPVETNHKVIQMPNIGMGGATFWYHIIENYDNLADITLFTQGHPFDADFETSKNWTEDKASVEAMQDFYLNLPYDFVASPNCFGMYIQDKFHAPPNYNQRHHDCFIYYTTSWQEWIDTFLDPTHIVDFYQETPIYRNGQISLTKECIRSNSKEYYIKIMDQWKYDNPLAEWLFEISAAFIFNIGINGKYKDYRHDLTDTSNLVDYKKWMYEINE